MRKSILPFLRCSLLALVFVSCSTTNVVKGYEERMPVKDVYQNPYFANSQTDYVYKANISVYGNDLSGIFIAKKINDTSHRVVFTTEFGNKLLDFEISETDFKVNSIVEELNRKILISTLKADFRLLLKGSFSVNRQFENAESTVYQSNDAKNLNYLSISKSDGKLKEIVHASKTKEKIKLSFTTENNIFAEKIIIQHYNIKLRIELSHFKQN